MNKWDLTLTALLLTGCLILALLIELGASGHADSLVNLIPTP